MPDPEAGGPIAEPMKTVTGGNPYVAASAAVAPQALAPR